jgi:hypothetical protein
MKNSIIRVDEKELIQKLSEIVIVDNVPTFATVWQYTDARLLKTFQGNRKDKSPFIGTMKMSKVSIILNSDYKRALHLQLDRENKDREDYKQGKNTMIVEKCENNNFFGFYNKLGVLEYRPNDNVYPHTKFVFEGKIIDKKKLTDYLPTTNKAENQGTDREILWRKLYVSNIREISLQGKRYRVIK